MSYRCGNCGRPASSYADATRHADQEHHVRIECVLPERDRLRALNPQEATTVDDSTLVWQHHNGDHDGPPIDGCRLCEERDTDATHDD